MPKQSILRRGKSKSLVTDAGAVAPRLRAQNKKLLQWLDSWLATPDDRGETWWKEFEADREKDRPTFSRGETG
jgi:hypothetical protein